MSFIPKKKIGFLTNLSFVFCVQKFTASDNTLPLYILYAYKSFTNKFLKRKICVRTNPMIRLVPTRERTQEK